MGSSTMHTRGRGSFHDRNGVLNGGSSFMWFLALHESTVSLSRRCRETQTNTVTSRAPSSEHNCRHLPTSPLVC